jgi:hypothetical protein
MSNMFEKFYERYAPEEKEVIVLIQRTLGAGYDNGFWDMTVISLGMVFCATGEVNIREGRLEWPVTEEEINSKKGWNRFEREQICRVKIRELLDEYVPKHTTPEQFNSWAVTEMLEQSVSCPELEAVLEEYNKPVVIEDKVLGTLILNRDFGMFETTLLWNGNEVSFMLEVNTESKSSWSHARTAAKKLVTEQETWDKTMREFAAKKLTALANEWLDEDEESNDAKPITEEMFAKRITLSEISITSGGSFTAYYNDDDMFWGHTIEIHGSLKKGIANANISG